jgi:hypothetical protein
MTGEELQIDFQPQPRGIAVVTSAPISSIAESGHYSAFQDLIDGYASSFAKVHVFSPSGGQVVKPLKDHRVSWHSGKKWLSQTNGLWWSVLANRREFRDVELVRTFGPRAGVVGRFISKLSHAPHVSSAEDLVGNSWNDKNGLRAASSKLVNNFGVLRANVLSATLDWELEYLSETGYEKELLLGSMGLATDIYTPVGTTDPDRHPVVLWAGPVAGDEADQLKADIAERDLPITVASIEEVEPIVDLIERTWACVTTPGRGLPYGFAMLALSAGVPLISIGELDEKHGFENHLNYIGIEDKPDAVAYALQLLRHWTTWSLRIGIAGQKLVEERYSTRSVAIKEGEQLARIARGEDLEPSTLPKEAKILRTFVSPAAGEVTELFPKPVAEDESVEEEDQYASPGFDLVAAALAEMSGPKPTTPEPSTDSVDMSQDAISALFAANNENPEAPAGELVDLSGGDMDQDAISAMFAADNNPVPEPSAAEPAELADPGDVYMSQDDITALFAANDPEPEPSAEAADSGSVDMGQDAISALFAASDPEPEAADEPDDSASGDMGQDAISALFAANDPEPEAAAEPADSGSGDMGQDAISALFAANDPEPEPVSESADSASGDMGQDAISALFVANDPEPEPATFEPADSASGDMGQDAISALFAASDPEPEPATVEPEQDAVPTLAEAKQNAGQTFTTPEDEYEGDLPKVNLVNFNVNDSPTDVPYPDDPDLDDVDEDIISAMLEFKDEDPAA